MPTTALTDSSDTCRACCPRFSRVMKPLMAMLPTPFAEEDDVEPLVGDRMRSCWHACGAAAAARPAAGFDRWVSSVLLGQGVG